MAKKAEPKNTSSPTFGDGDPFGWLSNRLQRITQPVTTQEGLNRWAATPVTDPVARIGRPKPVVFDSKGKPTGGLLTAGGELISPVAEPNYGTTLNRDPALTDANKQIVGSVSLEKMQEDHAENLHKAKRAEDYTKMMKQADPGTVHRISWDEYNKLRPEQQRAIDFNTMLVKAVNKDLNHQQAYMDVADTKARKEYDKHYEEIFGAGEKSEIYAPETLGLLNQLGYENGYTTLDDFLTRRAAISDTDLANIRPTEVVQKKLSGGVSGTDMERMRFTNNLASMASTMEAELVKSHMLLNSLQQTAAFSRIATTEKLGGIKPQVSSAAMMGFGPASVDEQGQPQDQNTYFQQAHDALARSKNPEEFKQTASEIKGKLLELVGPIGFDEFWNYTTTRARNAKQYGVALTQNGDKHAAMPGLFLDWIDQLSVQGRQ